MWSKQEVEDMRHVYQGIKHVHINDLVDEAEKEAIEETAIYNLRNSIVTPRNLHRFLSTVRCQYICTDL